MFLWSETCQEATERMKGLFWFTVQGYSPSWQGGHGDKVMAARAWGGWSHGCHSQEEQCILALSWLSPSCLVQYRQCVEWYWSHLQWIFTPQLIHNPLQTCPEIVPVEILDPIKLTMKVMHSASPCLVTGHKTLLSEGSCLRAEKDRFCNPQGPGGSGQGLAGLPHSH